MKKTKSRTGALLNILSRFVVIWIVLWGAASCEREDRMRIAIIPEEETIAVVNSKKISLNSFNTRLHSFLKQYRQLLASDEKQLAQIKQAVINQLIEEELINQEASRRGVKISKEEVDAIIAESLSPFKGASMESVLKNSHVSAAEWKSRLRQYLTQKKLIEREIASKIPVTKREIELYYQSHRQKFVMPEAFKVRNITLSSYEDAETVRLRLFRGESFVSLVREYSISPDKALDGDLGYIEKGELPPEMESAIFSLKLKKKWGSISQVATSQNGFHIFKLEKHRRRKRLTLKEAKSEIKEILIRQRLDQAYVRWLEELKRNAAIDIDETMLNREEGF